MPLLMALSWSSTLSSALIERTAHGLFEGEGASRHPDRGKVVGAELRSHLPGDLIVALALQIVVLGCSMRYRSTSAAPSN